MVKQLKSNEYYKNVAPYELVEVLYNLLSNELIPRTATVEVEWNNDSHDVYNVCGYSCNAI
jgi:hypothetical protein